MSKKLLIPLAIVVALLIVATYWMSRGSSEKFVKSKSITIGVILPLTGGAASLGKPCQNGIQLSIDQFNQKQPHSAPLIRVVIEDDRADPAASIAAFQKLTATEGIRLVIGPLTSGGTLAVAPVAERNHVLILSPGASAPKITDAGDYIFRVELSEASGARAQADLAISTLNFKSIGLLYVNNEYGVGTVRIFRERFTELGGQVVSDEAFAPGTTDFRTALIKSNSRNPDALFVVFQDDIVNILKQRAELGVTAPIYTTPVFEDASNLAKLGPLAEGIVFTHYGTFNSDAAYGIGADFVAAYKAAFSDMPTYYSALGYDAAGVLLHALRGSGLDERLVKDRLYQTKGFAGVTGEISFDEHGDVTKPVTLKKVQGGRFVSY